MSILSSTDLSQRLAGMVSPVQFHRSIHRVTGMSFGLSACGYDVRLKQGFIMWPGRCVLGSTVERFRLPNDLCMRIYDKSTLARKFITVQNTIAEPGWEGYLTLEIINHSLRFVRLYEGQPIAQVCFELLSSPTDRPYRGKYQNQPDRPVGALSDTQEVGDGR